MGISTRTSSVIRHFLTMGFSHARRNILQEIYRLVCYNMRHKKTLLNAKNIRIQIVATLMVISLGIWLLGPPLWERVS